MKGRIRIEFENKIKKRSEAEDVKKGQKLRMASSYHENIKTYLNMNIRIIFYKFTSKCFSWIFFQFVIFYRFQQK